MNKEEYKSYPLFNDVDSPFLKAYNRIGIAINITERHGEDECKKYLEQFTERDQKLVHLCGQYIKQFGLEAVQKEALKAAGKLVGAGDLGDES